VAGIGNLPSGLGVLLLRQPPVPVAVLEGHPVPCPLSAKETPLLRSPVRRTALVATLIASLTGVTAILSPAFAVLSPVTASARARPAASTAISGAASTTSLLLINGDHALVSSAGGGRTTSILRPPGTGALAGAAAALRAGTNTFLLPGAALPYLGHGLDLSLFEVSALRYAERNGRLPVTVHYQGKLRALPGITVTHRGTGTAQGYLTAASAPAFGAALARQMVADRDHGSYGRDGLFAGSLSIGLPGSPAAAPAQPRRPGFPMHTLTVRGTNLSGRPDTGGQVFVSNVTDPIKFNDPVESDSFFYHGTAKFSVPAGVYWAFGAFYNRRGGLRLAILPQFTVRGDSTVTISERAADSKAAFITPRPAVNTGAMAFSLLRANRHGGASWTFFGQSSLWVSPISRPPSAGHLDAVTSTTLASPRGRGTPYTYALDFPAPPGTIPPQHFVVRPGDLATVHERYYQDATQAGGWLTYGGTARQARTIGFAGSSTPLRLPGQRTLYLLARPAMLWQTSYFIFNVSSGQTNAWRQYHAGQRLSENWNAYPLHPAPNVSLPGSIFQTVPSASRAQNTLLLDITPFSDSTFGHTGAGFQDNGGFGRNVSGSYALYQNGTKIASGKAQQSFSGDLFVQAHLSHGPARIKFEMTASRKGEAPNLSSTSQDTWTWPTRPDPAATVPPPWLCGAKLVNRKVVFDRHCAIQDMMTLRYQVAGLSLHGATRPGAQSLGITVSHLPLGTASRITHATAQVSYDNGRSWRHATLARTSPSQFRASYTAPAATGVSLRVTARDAMGATVTETILGAYQTAS
jgi:hypothetical protein